MSVDWKSCKLFRFSLETTHEVLYLIVSSAFRGKPGLDAMGLEFMNQDQGDIPWKIYKNLALKGKREEIISLDQVPIADQHWIPYFSEDFDLESDMDIGEFLAMRIPFDPSH